MADFRNLGRLRTVVQSTATVVLLAAAGATLLWPGAVETLTGVRPTPKLTAPDDLPPLSSEDATPFFQSRNEIEVRVAEATTLRQFLDRNRLNKPFQRKQIVDQLGNASPDAQIAAGTVFRLRLTPVAEDVPGVETGKEPTDG
ncbi:MAG TPA: hypothetical protein VFP80_05580 [Thermoanaerobaculia bacterium]|nr:hypothetical protein [Thermoanaerobaculia bacterium]